MCSVCGVELVPEELRGHPLDERQRKEKIVLVWKGGDPLAVSEVIHILRDAGIRHHVQPTNEHLVFELAMPRPKYAVRVFLSDLARAKELLANVRESAPFALDEPAEMPPIRIRSRLTRARPTATFSRRKRPLSFGAVKTRRSPIFSKPACAKIESECDAKRARRVLRRRMNEIRLLVHRRPKRHRAKSFAKCAKQLRPL